MESCGVLPKISAMTGACDAWKYGKLSGIPAIVFGPGQIKFAHSAEEQIRFEDVMIAAQVIEDFSNTF
jgi:acetylornithine deacetylase